MLIPPFSLSRLPRIEFGAGRFALVPTLAALYTQKVLLVTGGQSLRASAHWQGLTDGLKARGLAWMDMRVEDEPSPQLVDEAVQNFRHAGIGAVVGIGGGSVLDAAKAIAGLLPHGNSVMDYLEGVGPELPYQGPSLPFIAVPTTAGTGSEATKNAVLSQRGAQGFKKSFRDDQLVPAYAVVDPDLLAGCPPSLIAANGMDALTQLIESYVSLKANPMTDALALSGIRAASHGLLAWYEGTGDAALARGEMAYASLASGITLAQCGLGSVHGLAAPLGAFFPIPHGAVCGTLLAACTHMNLRAMRSREPGNPALIKYAELARVITGIVHPNTESTWQHLIDTLLSWTERLQLPRLGQYGVTERDFPAIVAHCRGSSMKTNPIVLTDAEITEILRERT